MISNINDIIQSVKSGEIVIVVDDEARENEGDLLVAAHYTTPQVINFMARYGCGLICLTLAEERCRRLNLPQMVASNQARHRTAFTVSIEAAEGVTTGISAFDRAHTVQTAIASDACASDLARPGHIFPLSAHPQGVLGRAGHTEAGCDLARLAGFEPASVICEIMREDGMMARLPDLKEFSRLHGLKIGTIADLIVHRCEVESLVELVDHRWLNLCTARVQLFSFKDYANGIIHFAYVVGDVLNVSNPMVLVDSFFSTASAVCFPMQSEYSLDTRLLAIASQGAGILVLLRQQESEEVLLKSIQEEPNSLRSSKPSIVLEYIGKQILQHILGDRFFL